MVEKRIPRRRLLGSGLAALALGTEPAAAAERHDELTPEYGAIVSRDESSFYEAALRIALLDAHPYSACRMLCAPSFAAEWAVYLAPSDHGAAVVSTRMKEMLWPRVAKLEKRGWPITNPQLPAEPARQVTRTKAPVSPELSRRLQSVWTRMLLRTTHPLTPNDGEDGATYHFCHWSREHLFLMGKAWSPDEGTRTAALVGLGEGLRDLATAKPAERSARETRLMAAADSLLRRLDREPLPARR